MDMQQVVQGAQGQQAGGMSGMLEKMMQMRAMMDEMITAMQSEGKQAGFESVDQSQEEMSS